MVTQDTAEVASRPNISICVVTYRLPMGLRRLLDSLELQTSVPGPWEIVIVDNDPQEQGRPVAEEFRRLTGRQVIYDLEPRKNISLARNRCLSLASGRWIALVDDDQTVSRQWLHHLLTAVRTYQADVVFGPVVRVYPLTAFRNPWVQSTADPPTAPTGTFQPFGGAGNALIRRSLLQRMDSWFDPELGLTGGEDVDFFDRARSAGGRLVWCQQASSREFVPSERSNGPWLIWRSFFAGRAIGRVYLRWTGPWGRLGLQIRWLLRFCYRVVSTPVLASFSRHHARRNILAAAFDLGLLDPIPSFRKFPYSGSGNYWRDGGKL